jgi:hypothetical protein
MYNVTLRSRVPAWLAALATVAVFAIVPPLAFGAEQPAFTAGPVIEGPAAVGGDLRITAAWRGVPAPAQRYEWDRCDASGQLCSVVTDACAATYTVSDGDVGARFQARVNLFNAVGTTTALTPLSDLVAGTGRDDGNDPGGNGGNGGNRGNGGNGDNGDNGGKHGGGGNGDGAGGPSTDGGSHGERGRRFGAQGQLFDAVGTTAARTAPSNLLAGARRAAAGKGPEHPGKDGSASSSCAPIVPPPAPTPAAAPPAVPIAASPTRPYLRPFPTVRIAGYTVAGGARITLVSVRGGASAIVRTTCAGAGCRRRALSPAHAPARLRALERFFRAGTTLQIRVTAGATIGKYTSFRILANHAPRRVDRCLLPGRWAPVRCPAPGAGA